MTGLPVALEAARAAHAVLRERSGGPRRVDHKGAVDLVTEVDLACEEAVREVLARRTPGVPVLGEEGGGAEGAGTRWVVDPLDGTTNFVHGFPPWAVSVALEVDGVVEAGVVIDASRDLEYAAARGRGATCGGEPIRVSQVETLDHALVATGFPYDRRRRAAYYLAYFQAVMERVQGVRRAGAAAVDLARLASGAADAFWEFGLGWWDVAAGVLLVEEAGGRVTAHDGGPLDRPHPCPLATNGDLHEAMQELLAEVRSEVGAWRAG